MLIDTHCHLDDEKFRANLDEIVQRAADNTVEIILTSGTDVESNRRAIELAHRYPNVYATIGFFPLYADDFDEKTYKQMQEMAQDKKVVGIGEIGLEYTTDKPTRERQKQVFLQNLEIAHKFGKPIVIHCREAVGDMMELLKANKNLLSSGGTFHCFSESKEIAQEVIRLGLHISVGGVSTFKNASKVKEAVCSVPLERILLETDAPYLAPTPHRGEVNQPSFMLFTAQNLADMRGISVEEVSRVTSENARRLFGI